MSILTSRAYYRFCQCFGVLLFPAGILAFAFGSMEDRVTVQGVVESGRQVVITSPLDDTIVREIRVESGDEVKRGDVLIEFEDLRGFRNDLARKRVELKLLEKEYQNYLALYQKDLCPGEKVWDLERKIALLKPEIATLTDDSERLLVRAPFSGRIPTVEVEQYEKVEIGTPLLSLSGHNAKIIRCKVPERYCSFIREGQSVNIKSNLYNYLRYDIYRGNVQKLSPFGGQEDGNVSYEMQVSISEGIDMLKLGSIADCEVIVDKQPLAFILFSRR